MISKLAITSSAYEIFRARPIDYRYGDYDEQIGHFPYRNSLGSVAYHSEDGEQSQGESYLKFNAVHQEDEQEHRGCKGHKGDTIFIAAALFLVNQVGNNPTDEKVEGKSQQQIIEVRGL